MDDVQGKSLSVLDIDRGFAVTTDGEVHFGADGANADQPFDQMPRPGFLGTESFIETIL